MTDDWIYAPQSFGYSLRGGRARSSCMKQLVSGLLMAWKCKLPSCHSLKGVKNMQKRHFGQLRCLSHILSECTCVKYCNLTMLLLTLRYCTGGGLQVQFSLSVNTPSASTRFLKPLHSNTECKYLYLWAVTGIFLRWEQNNVFWSALFWLSV